MSTSRLKNDAGTTEAQTLSGRHFHEVRFSEGEKWLWNPAQKRLLRDRPEERVRLRCMEWLHHDCGVPINRMSTELPVKRKMVGDQFRADILAYDAAMKPFILVECKSADVKLNELAGMQAARYNEQIKAPFIVLSNGLGELGFSIKGDGIEAVSPASFHLENPETTRDFSYWHRRGFAGSRAENPDRLVGLLNRMYDGEPGRISYIKAPKMDAYPHVNHYYITLAEWTLGVMAHNAGSTWLCGLQSTAGFGNLMVLICLDGSTDNLPGVIFSQNARVQIPADEALKIGNSLSDSKSSLQEAESLLSGLTKKLL